VTITSKALRVELARLVAENERLRIELAEPRSRVVGQFESRSLTASRVQQLSMGTRHMARLQATSHGGSGV
jgi:hypothetical protein